MTRSILLILLSLLCLLEAVSSAFAFQNLFTPPQLFRPPTSNNKAAAALEQELIDTINSSSERLTNDERITNLIEQLESQKSIDRPAISPTILGRWRLIHTSNANTSSPIQRKAVGSKQFPIYQDILLRKSDDSENTLIVSQVVQFGEKSNQLCVDALASTSQYPLPELTERVSTGKVLGLNVLGVSLVGDEAQPNPDKPDSRIDFVFDEGKFQFGKDLTIPYPVPFRLPLLRDWVKGWIDITYLSTRMRISRGNKGTTFVLVKEEE